MTKPDNNIALGFSQESFPAGTHMCLFYTDEQERLDVISKFLQAGLTAGEHVGYFAKTLPPEELIRDLTNRGIDISNEDVARQLSIASTEATYHPDGCFDPDRMLGNLHTFYSTSMEDGYSGARVSGEMHWALQDLPGVNRLIEYEARVNIALKRSPVTAICQYNTTLFDGKTVMNILRVHPAVILRGRITRNPFYSLPDEFKAMGDSKQ
jgi:hypothetical protein